MTRLVVVTGAARGIGDAIVGAFREAGDDVVSLDLADCERPREGCRYVHCDITDPEAVHAAFEPLERVDVLVNNAGIQRVGLVGELTYEQWQAVLGTHLNGSFLCNSQAVPKMREQGAGAIVHIASTAALLGLPGRGPYSAAKAGLGALTRVLAVELAPLGIRVNAVAPGFTRTQLVQQAIDDGSLQEDWMVERVPMGRLARPDEIARVVRFLASDESSYVTGQVVVADGGWTVQGIGTIPSWLDS